MIKNLLFVLAVIFLFPPTVFAGDLTLPVYDLNINSFFDHDIPDYTDNDKFVKYDTNQWTDGSADIGNCTLGVNCYDGHNGVDFDGDSGDDILSAAPGVVREQYWNNCGGNTMRILHPSSGYSTLYSHLLENSYLVDTDDSVLRFQHVAEMGQTGSCVTGDHLHFGVSDGDSLSNKRADPFGWEGQSQNDPCQSYSDESCVDLGYLWTTDPPSFDLGENYNVVNVTQDITEDTTWEYGNIYVVYGKRGVLGATLTIEPGVIVKFNVTSQYNSSSLDIYGDLVAQGTEQNKIYFTSLRDDSVGGDTNGDATSTLPAASDYAGINIYTVEPIEISNSVLRYGGKCQGQFSCAARGVITGLVSNVALTVSSSTIQNNNYGIYLSNISTSTVSVKSSLLDDSVYGLLAFVHFIDLSVTDTIISNNDVGLYASTNYDGYKFFDFSITNSDFLNNKKDTSLSYYSGQGGGEFSFINEGNFSSSTEGGGFYLAPDLKGDQIFNPGVTFVVGSLSIPQGSSLTVNPGTVIKILDNWSNGLGVGGHLSASGTPEQKIYFTSFKDDTVGGDTNNDGTSTSPAAEDFTGIVLHNGVSSANFFNSVIRYGGRCAGQHSCQTRGGISVLGGELNIASSTIQKNRHGIYHYDGETNVSQSSIKDNTLYGIFRTSNGTGTTTAINNWWGKASGPYHPTLNPNGQGNDVSNNVDFIPWLTKDPFKSPVPGF